MDANRLQEIKDRLESGSYMDPGKFLDASPTDIADLVAEVERLKVVKLLQHCIHCTPLAEENEALRELAGRMLKKLAFIDRAFRAGDFSIVDLNELLVDARKLGVGVE